MIKRNLNEVVSWAEDIFNMAVIRHLGCWKLYEILITWLLLLVSPGGFGSKFAASDSLLIVAVNYDTTIAVSACPVSLHTCWYRYGCDVTLRYSVSQVTSQGQQQDSLVLAVVTVVRVVVGYSAIWWRRRGGWLRLPHRSLHQPKVSPECVYVSASTIHVASLHLIINCAKQGGCDLWDAWSFSLIYWVISQYASGI